MYKNLNDLTNTNISVSYNNTKSLGDINRQLGVNISFVFQDLDKNKCLVVQGRVIKNCVIQCPNGQMWTSLNYIIHNSQYEGDKTYTQFDFSYVLEDQWDKVNPYVIYVGSADNSAGLFNTPEILNQQQEKIPSNELLVFENGSYGVKRLIAGDGIQIVNTENKNALIISTASHNYLLEEVIQLSKGSVQIDVVNGNIQIVKSQYNTIITNIKYSLNDTVDEPNILNATLMLYKPNDTVLKYKENILLMQYDRGWFSFSVKKCNGYLFFSEPTRVITDYIIDA